MIVVESCDHCQSIIMGKVQDISYEREDGDTNVLCIPCMRDQLEADFKASEKEEKGEQ